MNQYLLDTNICAFYLRGRFDVDQRMDQVGWENCFISEITMLELKMGAELSLQRDGIDRAKQLDDFFSAEAYLRHRSSQQTILWKLADKIVRRMTRDCVRTFVGWPRRSCSRPPTCSKHCRRNQP